MSRAKGLLPDELLQPLPTTEALRGAPEWYSFELKIWALGEEIRQLLVSRPRLRRRPAVQAALLEVACDRRALRGRQSFIMLLGYKACAGHARVIAAQLDDPSVNGHVISTLHGMRAPGFAEEIAPFLAHPESWIRLEARRYMSREGAVEQTDAADEARG